MTGVLFAGAFGGALSVFTQKAYYNKWVKEGDKKLSGATAVDNSVQAGPDESEDDGVPDFIFVEPPPQETQHVYVSKTVLPEPVPVQLQGEANLCEESSLWCSLLILCSYRHNLDWHLSFELTVCS